MGAPNLRQVDIEGVVVHGSGPLKAGGWRNLTALRVGPHTSLVSTEYTIPLASLGGLRYLDIVTADPSFRDLLLLQALGHEVLSDDGASGQCEPFVNLRHFRSVIPIEMQYLEPLLRPCMTAGNLRRLDIAANFTEDLTDLCRSALFREPTNTRSVEEVGLKANGRYEEGLINVVSLFPNVHTVSVYLETPLAVEIAVEKLVKMGIKTIYVPQWHEPDAYYAVQRIVKNAQAQGVTVISTPQHYQPMKWPSPDEENDNEMQRHAC